MHTHTHTHLTALFPGLPGWAGTRKVKPIWILLKQESEWQWHQLGHMQVCTLLQTDNHASNPPLSFLQAGCPSCRPTCIQCTSSKTKPDTNRGPRRVLWVVVVTTSAYSNGPGITFAAIKPEMCAMSAIRYAFCSLQICCLLTANSKSYHFAWQSVVLCYKFMHYLGLKNCFNGFFKNNANIITRVWTVMLAYQHTTIMTKCWRKYAHIKTAMSQVIEEWYTVNCMCNNKASWKCILPHETVCSREVVHMLMCQQ